MRIDGLGGVTVACGALLTCLVGCPGKLEDKAAFEAALADAGAGAPSAGASNVGGDAGAADLGPCGDVVLRIFAPTCGGTGCHGATASQQGLDLVSPGVGARVVGVTAKQCRVPLADPANAEGSLMYLKLLASPPCGAQMPLARPPLSSADASCVLNWIKAL